jgi:hypothetical protein
VLDDQGRDNGERADGARKPRDKRLPREAEGEGFESSIRLTTDNVFETGKK